MNFLKLFIQLLLIFSCPCHITANEQLPDSVPIVFSVNKLTELNDSTIIFRTYSIKFQFFNRHLDTFYLETVKLLDSLSSFIFNTPNVDFVEVGIHLSQTEWHESYSVSPLYYMYEDIVNYLIHKGVPPNIIKGKQYYNYFPLINCNLFKDRKRIKCFNCDDTRLNRRVEFVIKRNFIATPKNSY